MILTKVLYHVLVLAGAFSTANAILVNGFIFGGKQQPKQQQSLRGEVDAIHATDLDPSHGMAFQSRLPNIYAVAVSELQELELEPLCHRIAARMLVNHCQLLDGKDDTTVLTDSGGRIRDFVDSFAVSLAICDLERGRFVIPPACSRFREDILSSLPTSAKPNLHVSSLEIDSCLSALGKSTSAWNTWVSYRHKALRFCEVAQADNEKAKNIRLYQRITEILGNLANGVDLELEKRLSSVERRTRQAAESLDVLGPHIKHLKVSLDGLSHIVSGDLRAGVRDTSQYVRAGLQDSHSLRQALETLFRTLVERNAEFTVNQDLAVTETRERIVDAMEPIHAGMSTALATINSLQMQMESWSAQTTDMMERQSALETNALRLVAATESLSSSIASHEASLIRVSGKVGVILEKLDKVEDSAGVLQSSFSRAWGVTQVWPYVVCPVATLIMGSYGLPPSGFRNLGLIAMGELAGHVVSLANSRGIGFRWLGSAQPTAVINDTVVVAEDQSPIQDDFVSANLV